MIIRFDEIEQSVMPNFKGGEKALKANMFFDGTNRMFKGCLEPGATIGVHTHEDSCEVIFITGGSGSVFERTPDCEDIIKPVKEGDCLYCPKGHTHSLMNSSEEGDLTFLAVVAQQL